MDSQSENGRAAFFRGCVDEAKRLELRRGRFEAEVAPQPEGRPMICLTPQGRATVLGTRFFLTALQQQGRFEVLRGTV